MLVCATSPQTSGPVTGRCRAGSNRPDIAWGAARWLFKTLRTDGVFPYILARHGADIARHINPLMIFCISTLAHIPLTFGI